MWVVLAASLGMLSWQRHVAFGLLLLALGLATSTGVLTLNGWFFLIGIGLIAILQWRFRTLRVLTFFTQTLLLIAAIGLFFHYIPGFHNPKVLNSVTVGPHSTPFSMYFNLDKALLPFLLLAAYPKLLGKGSSRQCPLWQWIALILSVPVLLLIATLLGKLNIERHYPDWLWQFMLANLFFVSFAEEALFRGYLQQRLTAWLGTFPALISSALLFGLIHFAGGWVMMLFALLAGIIYGLAWIWSGRLWVATLFHFGLNLTHLLFFTYPFYRP